MARTPAGHHCARLCTLTWVVLAAAVAAARAQTPITLRFNSPQCTTNAKTVTCNVTGQDAMLYQNIVWGTIDTMEVVGASSFIINEQCTHASNKTLVVRDSQQVKTGKVQDVSCAMRLRLHDSEVTRISGLINNLKVYNSRVQKIDLKTIEQFDIEQSSVESLSVRTNTSQTTIVNSTIEVVHRLELEGYFVFQVTNSNFKEIKHFVYDSFHENSKMTDVKVGSIRGEGFTVRRGKLFLIRANIEQVEDDGMVVDGGALDVADSNITDTGRHGLVIRSGSVSYNNVVFGTDTGTPQGFSVSDASGSIYPYRMVMDCPSSLVWIILAALFGLVLGAVAGAAVLYFLKVRTSGKLETMNDMELLTSMEPKSLPSSKDAANVDGAEEEVYEEYTDVEAPIVKTIPPAAPPSSLKHMNDYTNSAAPQQGPGLQSPNVPPLPSRSPALPSNSPANVLPPVPKSRPPPPTRLNSTLSASQTSSSLSDERDQFPPPPPDFSASLDDQDMYDEVEVLDKAVLPARPQVPAHKPSFLHTPQIPPPVQNINRNAAGNQRVLPALPNRPPPPPQATKPGSSSNTFSDTEEDIYETVE